MYCIGQSAAKWCQVVSHIRPTLGNWYGPIMPGCSGLSTPEVQIGVLSVMCVFCSYVCVPALKQWVCCGISTLVQCGHAAGYSEVCVRYHLKYLYRHWCVLIVISPNRVCEWMCCMLMLVPVLPFPVYAMGLLPVAAQLASGSNQCCWDGPSVLRRTQAASARLPLSIYSLLVHVFHTSSSYVWCRCMCSCFYMSLLLTPWSSDLMRCNC